MKRSAQLAILVFGLLALLATPAAEADPPTLLVSQVTAAATGPSGAPVVAVPAPVNLSSAGAGSPPAAESAVQSFLGSPVAGDPIDEKLPVSSPPTPSGNSGNNVSSTSAVTDVKEAVAPASPLDRTPPDNVRGLSAKAADRAVTLRWRAPADADFNHVVISRAPQMSGRAETAVYNGPAKRFVDRRLTNGVAYRYVIVSYDQTGNRSAGVAIIAAPKALMLVRPSDGARVKAPPLLRWVWIPGATFYNVQLFRGPTRIKVMTTWPATNRLQLPSRWVYAGRRQRLVPGIYRWVVWPAFGRQIAKKYGSLLGESTFSVVAGKKKK